MDHGNPPAGVDVEQPSSARIYDYYLGGDHHFAVDRAVADQVIAAWPDGLYIVRENRAFLRRAVRYLVQQGIRQFLDIGSGIPTVGNVHEVAHDLAPDARVVYVDIDPVAVAHSREILAGDGRVAVLQEDFFDPDAILGHTDTRRLLDLDAPVAVLVLGVLHFFPGPQRTGRRDRAPARCGLHGQLPRVVAPHRREPSRSGAQGRRGLPRREAAVLLARPRAGR